MELILYHLKTSNASDQNICLAAAPCLQDVRSMFFFSVLYYIYFHLLACSTQPLGPNFLSHRVTVVQTRRVTRGFDHVSGHFPKGNRHISADGDDGFLIRRDVDSSDVARMGMTNMGVDAAVVVPQLDETITADRYEMRTGFRYGEAGDVRVDRALDDANGRAIKHVPVCDLAIRTGGDELGFIRVVDERFELCRIEETGDTVTG